MKSQYTIIYGVFDIAINFKITSIPHKKQKIYYSSNTQHFAQYVWKC